MLDSLRVLLYADIPIRLPKTGVALRSLDVLALTPFRDWARESTCGHNDDGPRPNHNDSIEAHHMSLYGVSVTNGILLQWERRTVFGSVRIPMSHLYHVLINEDKSSRRVDPRLVVISNFVAGGRPSAQSIFATRAAESVKPPRREALGA
jgi:hypothetical protein